MRELRDMHQSIDDMLKQVVDPARKEDKVYPAQTAMKPLSNANAAASSSLGYQQ